LEEQFDYYFYHGMVLLLLQRMDEARVSFVKAESMASTDEQNEMIAHVMNFLQSQ
jgi:predicted RNA polymerase sigma factor